MRINEDNLPIKLDKKDLLILDFLKRNSRDSIQQIAKKTRLSRDIVSYRINKLKERGVISKFTLNLDYSCFGYNFFLVLVQLNELDEKQEQDIIKFFNSQKNIVEAVDYFDKWDYMMIIQAKSIYEFDRVLNLFSKKFGEFILDQNEIFILKDFFAQKIKLDYDDKDINLLNLLLENSRTNTVNLGKKLNLSSDAIIYRIRKYKGIHFTVQLNNNLMDYHTYDLIFKFRQFTKQEESKLSTFISMNKNIIAAYKLLGDWNLFLRIRAKEPVELNKLMKKIKALFGFNIKDFDVMHAYFEIKNNKFL